MNLPPPNFRLVCAEKSKRLYRSEAAYDKDSTSVQWLQQSIGIKCYMDFRDKIEVHPMTKLNDYFILKKSVKDDQSEATSQRPGFRYLLNFLYLHIYIKMLFYKMTWYQILRAVLLYIQHLIYKDLQYIKYIGQCVFKTMHLGGLYCMLLDYSHSTFREAFLPMTNKNNFPMLISCVFGKDRTGVICALLMNLLGCNDEWIVKEYSKSQDNLKYLQKELETFFENKGTPKHFIGSPPEAMIEMLRHLKEKYGDAEGYLLYCGMSKDEIEKIKRNITNS